MADTTFEVRRAELKNILTAMMHELETIMKPETASELLESMIAKDFNDIAVAQARAEEKVGKEQEQEQGKSKIQLEEEDEIEMYLRGSIFNRCDWECDDSSWNPNPNPDRNEDVGECVTCVPDLDDQNQRKRKDQIKEQQKNKSQKKNKSKNQTKSEVKSQIKNQPKNKNKTDNQREDKHFQRALETKWAAYHQNTPSHSEESVKSDICTNHGW